MRINQLARRCPKCGRLLIGRVCLYCSSKKEEAEVPKEALVEEERTERVDSNEALGPAALAAGAIALFVPLIFAWLFAGAAIILGMAARPRDERGRNIPAALGIILGILALVLMWMRWPFK